MVKGSFAEDYLRKSAPDLHFAHVLNVSRQRDAPVDLVALDAELLQQIGVALGVYYLPVRVRRSRHFEVVRQGEYVFSVHSHVGNRSGVCLRASEFGAGVAFLCKNASSGQQGKRSE